MALALASGCTTIPRLVAAGEYQAAIERAQAKRKLPRRASARAYATALVQTGRLDEARGVLFTDFRHGGELRSLVMLADLELDAGLAGVAAVHYGRIADLDRTALRGRTDACELLRRRADGFARQGAGEAAQRDLLRADQACGEPTELPAQQRLAATVERTRKAQRGETDARVAATRCRDGGAADCDQSLAFDAALGADALAAAQSEGPRAVRRVASEHALSLSAEWVVGLLVADMRGELSASAVTLVGDDEVRRWVGDQTWSDLAPLVMTRSQGEAAYLQLRLAAVVPDMPLGPKRVLGPDQRTVWAAQATDTAGPTGWRIFAWLGDLGSTELALATAYRPRPTGTDGEGTGSAPTPPEGVPDTSASAVAPTRDDIVEPLHWTASLGPTSESLEVTLMMARLRHHRGSAELALEVARYAIARASAAGVEDATAIATRFAGWHLAYGRYWQALAVADAAPDSLAHVAAAASTAILLARALCAGPCADDVDRDTVTRALGEAWTDAHALKLGSRSVAHDFALPAASGCPTVGERLAAGGPLAAIFGARDRSDPGLPAALSRIVESDITLGCSARDATEVWPELALSPTAEALAEILSHEPGVSSPEVLHTSARLAMLAGRQNQASNLAIAAAASSRDPAEAWRSIAAYADTTGHRDLELMALREALLHTSGLHAPALRDALLVEALADVTRSWGATQTEVGRETIGRLVDDHFDSAGSAGTWAARESFSWRLASESWWTSPPPDAPWRALVEESLIGPGSAQGPHATAVAALRNAPLVAGVGIPDAAGLVLAARGGSLHEIPAATAVLADPVRMTPVRLAVARHGAHWQTRWRTAIGVAVYGDARSRAEGIQALLEMSTPAQRAAVVELMLALPAALQPAGSPRSVALGDAAPDRSDAASPVALVVDDHVMLRLSAGLPLAPAWFGR